MTKELFAFCLLTAGIQLPGTLHAKADPKQTGTYPVNLHVTTSTPASHAFMAGKSGDAGDFTPVTIPDTPSDNEGWKFEAIATDGSTSYYIYNLGTHQFLNDDNTLSEEARTLWTVSGDAIQSESGRYISLTSKNTGNLFKPNWVFTTVSNATTSASMSAIEDANCEYYRIGNKVNVSTINQQTRFLTVNNGSLGCTTNSDEGIEPNAQWIFVSVTQYNARNEKLDFTALVEAMNTYGPAFTARQSLQGFGKGEYAPYTDKGQVKAFEEAYDALANSYNYTQSDLNSITARLSSEWPVNQEEVNAIAPSHTTVSLTAGQTWTYGAPDTYRMPLSATTIQALTFSTSGDVAVSILDAEGNMLAQANCSEACENVSFRFRTAEAQDYQLTLTSAAGAELTDISIFTVDANHIAMPWTPQAIANGTYLIYNKATGLFISAPENEEANAATPLADMRPTRFTIALNEDQTCEISHEGGKLGVMIATSSSNDHPSYVVGSANADEGTTLTVGGNQESYTFSFTKNWKYNVLFNAQHTAYLSVSPNLQDAGRAKLSTTVSPNDFYGEWILVLPAEYETTLQARLEAIERLEKAVGNARQVQEEITEVPGISKTILGVEITSSEALLATEKSGTWSWISSLVNTTTINRAADGLNQLSSDFMSLADYYAACKAAIANIERISSGVTLRALTTTAKASLELAGGKEAMLAAMTTLRAGVSGYLQTVKTFADGQTFTGMLGNHSFDTGDMSQWYSVGVDMGKVSISDVTGAISGGDASSLANVVTINEWKTDTRAVRNEDAESEGRKYHLNARQMLMQPLLGMPAGIYEFSATVSCNPGLLKTDKLHLSVLVVPQEIVQQVIGDVTSGDFNWNDLMANFDMAQYMGTFLQHGKLYSGSTTCTALGSDQNAQLRFFLNSGDIMIVGIDAGTVPFLGNAEYTADNLQLTYLRSANGILDIAKAKLSEEMKQHAAVTANCTTGDPFTYAPDVTEAYNQAYDQAQDKLTNDRLKDIQGHIDLSDLEHLDEQVAHLYDDDIQHLIAARQDFDTQAFIAPAGNEEYNIVMKDSWFDLLGRQWTGNALTVSPDLALQFSTKPGEGNYSQAFSFVMASDNQANLLKASTTIGQQNLYLALTDGQFTLTTQADEALTLKAIPSTTREGIITLTTTDDQQLGTADNNSLTLSGTHAGLGISQAKPQTVTLTVTNARYATLILPFQAEVPEGLTAYSVNEIGGQNGVTLQLQEAGSLEACTPYIIMGEPADYSFTGISRNISYNHTDGLLTGTMNDYTTQGGEYVLQNQDGLVGFYLVDTAHPTVKANHCYITSALGIAAKAMYFGDEDNATRINSIGTTWNDDSIYDLNGHRVSRLVKGQTYIIGGKKVYVR